MDPQQQLCAGCLPGDEEFGDIACNHAIMTLEQTERVGNIQMVTAILRAYEGQGGKVAITGLGKCPVSMDKRVYDRWNEEKREDAPRDAFHAYMEDHGFEANLRKMLANYDRDTSRMRVMYSRSGKVVQESSRPLGRLFGAGLQRVRREFRGIIHGPGVEIDIANCMPTALCDLCLTHLFEGNQEHMLEAGFAAVWRLGRGDREAVLDEVQNALQIQVTALEAGQKAYDNLRLFKDRNEIIAEANRAETEKSKGPFHITREYTKRFVLSAFLRKERPRVSTPVTDSLWEQSNRLY